MPSVDINKAQQYANDDDAKKVFNDNPKNKTHNRIMKDKFYPYFYHIDSIQNTT